MTRIIDFNSNRKTAGELSNQASRDTTKYNNIELGHALTDDIAKEMLICAHRHEAIFDMPEFFVCYVIASDPLLHNLMRRKFFALPYLPQPRPDQAVFLYSKVKQQFLKRLWVLPNAATMAILSEMDFVDPAFATMKFWSDAFYTNDFFNIIRKQHGITDLSEKEYLDVHREEYIKLGLKNSDTLVPEPFDFSKIEAPEVINTA